jgi:hypothetical protein
MVGPMVGNKMMTQQQTEQKAVPTLGRLARRSPTIHCLMDKPSKQKRTSVRSARKYYLWINDLLPEEMATILLMVMG